MVLANAKIITDKTINDTMTMNTKSLLTSLSFAAAIFCSAATCAQPLLLDEVVAVVDDDVVMASELEQRVQMITSQLRSTNSELPQEDILHQQILDQLIIESLQLQMGRRAGISMSAAEITQHITRLQQNSKLLA